MGREPFAVRALILVLACGLVLSAGGCLSGEQRAQRPWSRIGPGMSRADVLELIGAPDRVLPAVEGETWHYGFGSSLDFQAIGLGAAIAVGVLAVVGILALLSAGSSHSGSSVSFCAGDAEPMAGRVHFRVVFDRTRRVVEISGLEPCEE